MLLYIVLFTKRAVFPLLSHIDGRNCVRIIRLLHFNDFIVCNCSAVSRHKIVEPLMIHGLMLGKVVEHGVQHSVEIFRHKVFRFLQQLMVRDVLT